MSERALLVQTAFVGDIVLTTPLLREIRRARPGCAITVVTTPPGAALLAGHPDVDVLVPFDKKGRERGLGATFRTIRALRASRFDVAVAAQRSARTGLLVRGSGAPLRVGFSGAAGTWAYSDRVPWESSRHAVHRYLALAAPLGGDPGAADPTPHLPVRPEARERVDTLLDELGVPRDRPLVAIAPGSIWGTKRWTVEGFAEVAGAVPGLGATPVLTGSPDEAPLCREVSRRAGGRIAVLAGSTGLPELVALAARARALVVNDSGPGHVASAVGTPVVAIFGPTVPAFGYTPWGEENVVVEHDGLECRPCDRHGPQVCPLGHHRCMNEISAGRVLGALGRILQTRPG